MLCFQSLAVLPSLKRFFNVRRQLHSADHISINSAQEGLCLLLWWEDALSGCKSNQEQSSQYLLLIAMSKYDVDQAALATSLVQCVPFLASCSQFACTFASLLSIRGGFPTIAYIFLLLLPLVPHVWWFNKTKLSWCLEFFHFFSNICIYIRTAEIQLSFHCALKQEQGK